MVHYFPRLTATKSFTKPRSHGPPQSEV